MHNNKPWLQENPLTANDVQALIERNISGFKPKTLKPLGEGWDNTTWLVDGQWVFRIPKHNEGAKLLKNEINILPHLMTLTVAVPQPEWVVAKPVYYPYPFYGHQFLPGKSADQAKLTDDDRANLAQPLAEFLHQLHAFPIAKAQELKVQYDALDRVGVRKRYALTRERILELQTHQLVPNAEFYLDCFLPHLELNPEPCWVLGHGDFYARHLLLDQQKRLTAVIDWGDCEILHPAVDLRIPYQFSPKESHAVFWSIYGEVSQTTKLLAKLSAIYCAVTLVWYGRQVADLCLLQEGLKGLDFIKQLGSDL